jgi:hypothetical protein
MPSLEIDCGDSVNVIWNGTPPTLPPSIVILKKVGSEKG